MRIKNKIEEIETYLDELLEIIPMSLKEYKNDFKTRAACERYFEKIIEAVIDLAFLVIKSKGFKIPEDDKQTFDILYSKGVIPKNLVERLKEAKGMRNILAHEYGKVDDEIVFLSITKEIDKDVNEFIEIIKNLK